MMAHAGLGSRKEVKEYIRKGYVLVNGEVIKNDDFHIDEENDEVIVADLKVNFESVFYYMLNKPEGYISATFDNSQATVLDLFKEHLHGAFPVGRLDIDTTGLLLITNDGALAHRVLSPKSHVNKKYYVNFSGVFKDSYYDSFVRGITLDDGYVTLPASFELVKPNEGIITIQEGKFHQVKRMFEALGMKVTSLKRISFGPLELDPNLGLGEYRKLTKEEVELFFK